MSCSATVHADNVAVPAFACCCCSNKSTSAPPPGFAAANLQQRVCCSGPMLWRTDRLHRPCSSYYAGNANEEVRWHQRTRCQWCIIITKISYKFDTNHTRITNVTNISITYLYCIICTTTERHCIILNTEYSHNFWHKISRIHNACQPWTIGKVKRVCSHCYRQFVSSCNYTCYWTDQQLCKLSCASVHIWQPMNVQVGSSW